MYVYCVECEEMTRFTDEEIEDSSDLTDDEYFLNPLICEHCGQPIKRKS